MRLDGFAAWQAGDEPGELVTQPFRCDGDRLFVNAESKNGSLQVEVLDERGKPIAGFEADACKTVSADTLAEKDSWLDPMEKRTESAQTEGPTDSIAVQTEETPNYTRSEWPTRKPRSCPCRGRPIDKKMNERISKFALISLIVAGFIGIWPMSALAEADCRLANRHRQPRGNVRR